MSFLIESHHVLRESEATQPIREQIRGVDDLLHHEEFLADSQFIEYLLKAEKDLFAENGDDRLSSDNFGEFYVVDGQDEAGLLITPLINL